MACPRLYKERGCPKKRRLHLRSTTIHNRKVTLQCAALESLKEVAADLRAKGIGLVVVSSYRSCAEQAAIYNSGVRPAAKPGESYHNIGLAVDCYFRPSQGPEVRHAFKAHGWNQFDPINDPGHFTKGVTG